jgi:hypothetical protein
MTQPATKVSVETFLSVIIQCAILTVGLVRPDFRQKDVMFYLDLIKDVIHKGMLARPIDIQFVQIQRWLRRYEDLGWLSSKREGRVTQFRMKLAGFKGLLRALSAEEQLLDIPEALLIQHILDAYGPYLRDRLVKEKPNGTVQDTAIRQYLRPGVVFENQIRLLDTLISNQERRNQDSLRLQAFCQSELARGQSPEAIVQGMPSEFSYQLSHQKSFRDLLQEIPSALSEFEIREGFAHRHRRFYGPYLQFLQSQREFYRSMLQSP